MKTIKIKVTESRDEKENEILTDAEVAKIHHQVGHKPMLMMVFDEGVHFITREMNGGDIIQAALQLAAEVKREGGMPALSVFIEALHDQVIHGGE